jgi:hypothetical protein
MFSFWYVFLFGLIELDSDKKVVLVVAVVLVEVVKMPGD